MLAIRQISAVLARRGVHGADCYALLGAWWARHWKTWSGFLLEAPFLFAPYGVLQAVYEAHLESRVPALLSDHVMGGFVLCVGLLIGAELMARLFYLSRIEELEALIEAQQSGSGEASGPET
jgi:hypothetical protein